MSVIITLRIFEWWEFKLAPLLAVFYATSVFCETSLLGLWKLPLLLLASLAMGAIYVSVINDLTDIDTDKLAGKFNRFADKTFLFKSISLLICLIIGLCFNYFWLKFDLRVGFFYSAAWFAYTLYSVPPFRFKNRDIFGIIADAAGAHFFPFLFVVSATFVWIGKEFDYVWLILVGIWSLSTGIRGILWHQLQDFQVDKKSGVNTFATKYSKSAACLIGERVVFPIELISFIVLLIYAKNYPALIFLIFYFLIVWSKYIVWEINIVIAAPQPNYQIIMNNFYSSLFPLSIFILAVFHDSKDILIALIHFTLFSLTLISFSRDTILVIRDAFRQNRKHEYPIK